MILLANDVAAIWLHGILVLGYDASMLQINSGWNLRHSDPESDHYLGHLLSRTFDVAPFTGSRVIQGQNTSDGRGEEERSIDVDEPM